MPDIDFELITPDALQANDAVLLRRGAAPPNTGALITPANLLAGAGGVVGPASATDNALARFDTATGKLLQNGLILSPDTGELVLPTAVSPPVPAAGTMALFARPVGGRMMPVWMGPSGLDTPVQPHLAFNAVCMWLAIGGTNTADVIRTAVSTLGSATQVQVTTSTVVTSLRRLLYRITVAAATAVCGLRFNFNQWHVGGAIATTGGFYFVARWSTDTGTTVATHRMFAGLKPTAAATDVDPSTLTDMVGIGYDAADTEIQFMHNDATGAATKVALGASFPKPSVNGADAYELVMFSPPGTVQSVSYRVRNLVTGAEATGTVTTDLPTTATALAPDLRTSVGGTSSVVGMGISVVSVESDW